MTSARKLGPNMQRLLALFTSRVAVPNGGGFADAIAVLTNPERFREVNRKGLELADQAVAAMRAAPDNPYGNDEEAIAAGILAEVEKRTGSR